MHTVYYTEASAPFKRAPYSFERSENVLYAVAQLTGGKIQNAIWPKIWMLIFILGQNKSKQAKKNFDPARTDPA